MFFLKGVLRHAENQKNKGDIPQGKIYWITYMGLDGKQKFESTGSDLKADAELVLAQRRLDVDQGKEPMTAAGIGTTPSASLRKSTFHLSRIRRAFM